ncbi:MAG: FAD-dependent oxidoreductase [Bacteroidota bacterium]
MNRRKFLAGLAGIPALPLLLQSCDLWDDREQRKYTFPIQLHSDRAVGHLVFESERFPEGKTFEVETLIVGGGVAGLSAAASLPHDDFLLCELSDRLGGTSAAMQYNDLTLAQGAHYDLEYPSYYGVEVLQLLENVGVIYHQPWKQTWGFREREFIIPHESKNQCFDHGIIRSDVLEEGPEKQRFLSLMQGYSGKMTMPTRYIDPELRELNQMTFIEFLRQKGTVSRNFERGLDYHMLDDWGGTSKQVSALAGIHYFQCRPYYREVNQLFSPPSGNDYFVKKLARSVPENQLLANHLVKRIDYVGDRWQAKVVNTVDRTINKIVAKNVVYAGQKHALKHVSPQFGELFADNVYAPWLVMNFVLDKPLQDFGFWQNEMIVDDISFLGFINSASQHDELQNKQVLTAYYCLPPESRKYLAGIEKQQNTIVRKTIEYLSAYFKTPMESKVEAVFLNAMGHAMPIPTPNYLFQNRNEETAPSGFVFAGVDHHRLPLLFEAIDSGIEAVKSLYPESSFG